MNQNQSDAEVAAKQKALDAIAEYLHVSGAARPDQQIGACILALTLDSPFADGDQHRATSLAGNTSEAVGLSMYASNVFGAFQMGHDL